MRYLKCIILRKYYRCRHSVLCVLVVGLAKTPDLAWRWLVVVIVLLYGVVLVLVIAGSYWSDLRCHHIINTSASSFVVVIVLVSSFWCRCIGPLLGWCHQFCGVVVTLFWLHPRSRGVVIGVIPGGCYIVRSERCHG